MAKTFGFESTTDEVLEAVDLSGKRVLITGVSAGLGVETARAVVAHGGTVIGTARDLQKARRALAAALPPGASVELVEADLASLSSMRKAANELLALGQLFDVIIANAGVMACPQGKTADGFETQFGTNHLGHFVFVNKLVPLLKPGGRIVTLSSAGHQISDADLVRADRVPAIYRIRLFQDREHSLCARTRQPAQGTRHSRRLVASGDPDRAWPPHDAGTPRADTGAHRREQRGRDL
jgi:threonine dehydrogenase-like Zn-dependent dehydrogenase